MTSFLFGSVNLYSIITLVVSFIFLFSIKLPPFLSRKNSLLVIDMPFFASYVDFMFVSFN